MWGTKPTRVRGQVLLCTMITVRTQPLAAAPAADALLSSCGADCQATQRAALESIFGTAYGPGYTPDQVDAQGKVTKSVLAEPFPLRSALDEAPPPPRSFNVPNSSWPEHCNWHRSDFSSPPHSLLPANGAARSLPLCWATKPEDDLPCAVCTAVPCLGSWTSATGSPARMPCPAASRQESWRLWLLPYSSTGPWSPASGPPSAIPCRSWTWQVRKTKRQSKDSSTTFSHQTAEYFWKTSAGSCPTWLSGCLKPAAWQASMVDRQRYADNNITGTIPEDIVELRAMTYLRLERNKLSGPIPALLAAMTGLITIRLVSHSWSFHVAFL